MSITQSHHCWHFIPGDGTFQCFIPFIGCIVFRGADGCQSAYLLTSWWVSGLLPFLVTHMQPSMWTCFLFLPPLSFDLFGGPQWGPPCLRGRADVTLMIPHQEFARGQDGGLEGAVSKEGWWQGLGACRLGHHIHIHEVSGHRPGLSPPWQDAAGAQPCASLFPPDWQDHFPCQTHDF